AVVPYSAQAKGYFTKLGKLGYESMPSKLLAQYDNPTTRRRYEQAKQIVQQSGYTLNQIALAFLIQQPFVTIPIIGCKTLDHLEASMSALEVTETLQGLA